MIVRRDSTDIRNQIENATRAPDVVWSRLASDIEDKAAEHHPENRRQ
jgi:hypothetical protein